MRFIYIHMSGMCVGTLLNLYFRVYNYTVVIVASCRLWEFIGQLPSVYIP